MSKSRGPTKAQQILNEARQRVNNARENVLRAEAQLSICNAIMNAHERTYEALEHSLTTTRKKRTPKDGAISGPLTVTIERAKLNPPSPEASGGALTPEMIEDEKAKNRTGIPVVTLHGKSASRKQVTEKSESATVAAQ